MALARSSVERRNTPLSVSVYWNATAKWRGLGGVAAYEKMSRPSGKHSQLATADSDELNPTGTMKGPSLVARGKRDDLQRACCAEMERKIEQPLNA